MFVALEVPVEHRFTLAASLTDDLDVGELEFSLAATIVMVPIGVVDLVFAVSHWATAIEIVAITVH